MSILLIIITIWGASALASHIRQARIAKEQMRQREAQARLLREQRAARERERAETKRLIDLERARAEQEKVNAKLEKEQAKQAAVLAKHERRIASLEFSVEKAERDIEFFRNRIAQLDAQMDGLLLLQAGSVPGGKEHTKYQSKITSLENQIHTAEEKMYKAQHIKDMAQREIDAA